MDEIKKLGFGRYVDMLTFAELKRFIANINKYVREELVIRTTKKTHDILKKEVKSTWQVLNFDGVPALETKALKEIDDVLPRKSQNLKKPTPKQIGKYTKAQEEKILKKALHTISRIENKIKK